MSKFLSNITARIFFRAVAFIVIVLSVYLWFIDKLTNSQLGYLCVAVVMVYFPRKFAMKMLDVIVNKFKNGSNA